MGNLESYASGEGSVIFDARHYPVVFVTWFGAPVVELIEAYSKWMDKLAERATTDDEPFVIIGDTTGLTQRPGPAIRQKMAHVVDRLQTKAGDHLLGVFTVLDNAVMRAVFNMVIFLTRRRPPARPVRNLDEAFSRAFEKLEDAGLPRPEGLDSNTYQRPSPPLG